MAALDIHAGVGVDVRDFREFARALRLAAPVIKKQLTLELRAVGEIVATEARARAQPYSQTIPDSIKVRVSGAQVSVVATAAPVAGLLELGNAASRSTDFFNHPVFGNTSVWVRQPMHPFLGPAVKSKADEVEAAAINALDAAVTEAVKL